MASLVKGGKVGAKRLLFQRGDVELVIDFDALEWIARDFRKDQGAKKSPEGSPVLRRFVLAMKHVDEIQADLLVRTGEEQKWLDLRLAAVLDSGAFLIRSRRPQRKRAVATIPVPADRALRLDYNYECGEKCGTGGRVYYTSVCQQLLAVTDWVR